MKNTVGKVVKIIDTPAGFLFFAMTAMWLMLLIFGVNPSEEMLQEFEDVKANRL